MNGFECVDNIFVSVGDHGRGGMFEIAAVGFVFWGVVLATVGSTKVLTIAGLRIAWTRRNGWFGGMIG